MLDFHMRVKLHLQLAFKKHESETVHNCKKIFTGKNKCYAQISKFIL